MQRARALVLTLGFLTAFAPWAYCGTEDSAAGQASEPPADDMADYEIVPAEPDFTLITMPTNLTLPRHRLGMRMTHRFTRPLSEGDFGDLAADLFGFDGGAQVGLGLRFGLLRDSQLQVYRTSDRTIQLALQQHVLSEERFPLGLGLLASLEGGDNFSEEFAPALALILSRRLGQRGAVYATPQYVGNTKTPDLAPSDEDWTLLLDLGARLLLTRKLALVGEWHPRLAGYRGDRGGGDAPAVLTFGLESRVGGHAFQLSVSNTQATTPAQIARGQQGVRDWFLGFNLTRRFF